jgi:hypothetical protein
VRLAKPFLSAGMVALSPTSSAPIGYVIGRAIIRNSKLVLMS